MDIVIDGQDIRLYGDPVVVAAGANNFVAMRFRFGPEWAGYSKTVKVTNGAVTHTVPIDTDDTAYLPELTAGPWRLYVLGEKNLSRALTASLEISVVGNV